MTKLNDTTYIFISHERAITLLLWYQEWLVGDAPSLWYLRSKWPTPSRKGIRPISAHNISTVGDSEKSSITTNIKSTTGFPTSHRWSAYVTPKCPKGWLKERFFSHFEYKSTADRLKRCQLRSPVSGINIWWSAAILIASTAWPSTNLCSSYRPSRKNYLITIWCGSVSGSGDTCANP